MLIWMYIQQTWKDSTFLKTQLKRMEFDIFFNFNLSRAASCNIPIHSCLALVSWKDTMTDSTMRWRIPQATLLFAKKNIWVSMLRGHSREFKVQCHHETNKQTKAVWMKFLEISSILSRLRNAGTDLFSQKKHWCLKESGELMRQGLFRIQNLFVTLVTDLCKDIHEDIMEHTGRLWRWIVSLRKEPEP